MTDFEQATGCPHCEPYHSNPWTKAWVTYVSDARDGDGQSTTLHVLPTNGSHVAESDAEWLRQIIRDAKTAYGERKQYPLLAINAVETTIDEERARWDAAFEESSRQPQGRWRRPGHRSSVLDLSTFYIGEDSRDDSHSWAYVTHEPCGTDVFSGEREPRNPDMSVIWAAMAAHRCPSDGTVDGDGG